jgi:hypothetical protein
MVIEDRVGIDLGVVLAYNFAEGADKVREEQIRCLGAAGGCFERRLQAYYWTVAGFRRRGCGAGAYVDAVKVREERGARLEGVSGFVLYD